MSNPEIIKVMLFPEYILGKFFTAFLSLKLTGIDGF